MIEQLLRDDVWFGAALWAALYISDYYLTIYGARLYHRGANNFIVYEGSYELTPVFRNDVDDLKSFSPRFVRWLLVALIAIVVVWWLCVQVLALPDLYAFLVGGLVLREIAIHMRHLRNIASLGFALGILDGVRGRIEYAREFVLRLSAVELFGFATLWLLVFAATGNMFFLGGVVACAATGRQHWVMSRRAGQHDRARKSRDDSRGVS